MIRHRAWIALGWLVLLAACGPSLDPVLAADIDAYVLAHGQEWGEPFAFSGFVGVYERGEVRFARGYGAIGREGGGLADEDTMFRAGSLTKPFTAVAILQLEERGLLDVDDPVSRHLPDFPHAVTLHQLLSHTGGIPNYTLDPALSSTRDQPHAVDELVAWIAARPLDFEPGTQYAYSNGGYALLGAVIERVSGMGYGAYVEANIAAPAGMTRTRFGAPEGPNASSGFMTDERDALVPAFPIHSSFAHAAGGLSTTARDLVRFDRALRDGTLLAPASVARMTEVVRDQYAYGWVVADVLGHPVAHHGGNIDGYLSALVRTLDDDVVVVVWSNHTSVPAEPIGDAALRAFLGEAPEPELETPVVELEPAALDALVGTYALTPGTRALLEAGGAPPELIASIETVDVSALEGSLLFDPIGQPGVRLYPQSASSFFAKAKPIEASFRTATDGSVEVLFTVTGIPLELVRSP